MRGSYKEAKEVIQEGEEVCHVPQAILAQGVASPSTLRMRSGDLPWSFGLELDFRELKRLIVRAVDLFVPDFAGALNGTNPFVDLPDACG